MSSSQDTNPFARPGSNNGTAAAAFTREAGLGQPWVAAGVAAELCVLLAALLFHSCRRSRRHRWRELPDEAEATATRWGASRRHALALLAWRLFNLLWFGVACSLIRFRPRFYTEWCFRLQTGWWLLAAASSALHLHGGGRARFVHPLAVCVFEVVLPASWLVSAVVFLGTHPPAARTRATRRGSRTRSCRARAALATLADGAGFGFTARQFSTR